MQEYQERKNDLHLVFILTLKRLQVSHRAKGNLVFKWRRVEVRARYPLSLEDYHWPRGKLQMGFSIIKEKFREKSSRDAWRRLEVYH